MATIVKLGSGHWRAQIRRRQQYASRTFLQRAAAETWARDTERAFDKGIGINAVRVDHKTTFAKLIDNAHCRPANSGPRRTPITVEGGHAHGDCGHLVIAA